MSDTNTGRDDALLRRITELEGERSKANADAKKYRLKLREAEKDNEKLKADNKALESERDSLKETAAKSPDEWKQKFDELQQQIRIRNASDAWSEAIGGELAPKVTLEKLWSEIGYTPGEAAPTPEEIAEHVAKARESVPYLFGPAPGSTPTPDPRGSTKTTAKPPLKETVGVGRGAPDKSVSRVTVRRSQLQDPRWALDPGNKKMMADARSRGVLDVVDD